MKKVAKKVAKKAARKGPLDVLRYAAPSRALVRPVTKKTAKKMLREFVPVSGGFGPVAGNETPTPRKKAFTRTAPTLAPAWSLTEHGVTQSFLNSFLEDREATKLNYLEGWTPFAPNLPFVFGGLIHYGIEKMRERASANACDPAWADRLTAAYAKLYAVEHPNPTRYDLDSLEKCLGWAEALLPVYARHWASDWKKEWVGVEKKFKVYYTYPDGLRVPILGRRDGAFRRRDGIFLRETKTFSRMNEDDVVETLPTNTQVNLYVWSYKEEFGELPRGVVYDLVRRPGLKEKKGETLKGLMERVRADVASKSRAAHYFKRFDLLIEPADTERWKRTWLDPVMLQVRMWAEGFAQPVNPHHFHTPAALISKYGRSRYFDVIVKQDYSAFFRRKVLFSELEAE